MKRIVLLLSLLASAGTIVNAQMLGIETAYFKTSASVGGAILQAPTLASDQTFWFPTTGGTLVTTSNFGGWLVGGNALAADGLLGTTNGWDVQLISGGTSNVRMTLLNGSPAVLLPARTELRLGDASGGEYSALKAPHVQSGNITYVLPNYKPTEVTQRLQVDSIVNDTIVLGYATVERSSEVGFDLIGTETTTNSTTPIIVTGMSIDVEAYKTYAFEAVVSLCATNGNPKAGISFVLPAGAQMHYCHFDLTSSNGDTQCDLTAADHEYQVTPCSDDPAVHDEHYLLKGFIVTFGNGGTVDMYIRTTNGANPVRITRESYMQITTN